MARGKKRKRRKVSPRNTSSKKQTRPSARSRASENDATGSATRATSESISLDEEFRNFLLSFNNSDKFSLDLLKAIDIETGLEEAVVTALDKSRDVILTGAAGAGKTHLLLGLKKHLKQNWEVILYPNTSSKPHVLIIQDATVLTEAKRVSALKERSRSCRGIVIAINEGPLRNAALKRGGDPYKHALDMLHQGRQGLRVESNDTRPTVIDMAAYDPVEQEAIGHFLNLPILNKLVQSRKCDCPSNEDCPRLRAWKQLASSNEVRERVARIVKLAQLAKPDWKFRDVWELVSDLATGGSCTTGPQGNSIPTSVWFWRLFYGKSELAKKLKAVVKPETKSLPAMDTPLYYGDWGAPQICLLKGVDLIIQSKPEIPQIHLWLRLQTFLMGRDLDPVARVLGDKNNDLLIKAKDHQHRDVIREINSYMLFNQDERPSKTHLNLWANHVVQRKTTGAVETAQIRSGLLSLGHARVQDFKIEPSEVILNHPDSSITRSGGQRFLVHQKSKSSLHLTHEFLHLLQTGRARRISDRAHADIDWNLLGFFDSVSKEISQDDVFEVAVFDFNRLKVDRPSYVMTIDSDRGSIEEQ
jgi:hypothetical protein